MFLIEEIKNKRIRIGENAFKGIRNKKGFGVGILRKAHLVIRLNTMQQHEIDLLTARSII